MNSYRWKILALFFIVIIFVKFHRILDSRTDAINTKVDAGEDLIVVPLEYVFSGEPIILEQDDKRIHDYIWKHNHIIAPSEKAYNLEQPETDPSRGQGQMIRKLLKNMANGFFVEAGALDGETRSNTLYLEKNLNWKGLLIEGDPNNFEVMKTKNRKAWISNTCLAVKPYPHKAQYLQHFNVGKILKETPTHFQEPANTTNVQCMPLFSLLTALPSNVSTIDYFSLDVEGSELKVLKTIPFDKVFIKTISVEFEHTEGGKKGILDFMRKKGFVVAGEVTPPKYSWANDVILIHESLKDEHKQYN